MPALILDVSSLKALDKGMRNIKARMGEMQAEALNLGGDRLYDLVQRWLATRYKISWTNIDIALDYTPATDRRPEYSLTFSNQNLPYRRWITSRDEKVCKICGPRDGQIYHLMDLHELYPAHPNCRCRLEKLGIRNAFADMPDSIMEEPMQIAADHFLEAFSRAWNAADRTVP